MADDAPGSSTGGIRPAGQFALILADWRDHWRTGLAVMVGMGLGTSIMPSVFSLFILPLQHDFGWSRGEIGLANASAIAGGAAAPFAGRLLDRVGVRRPLLAGTVLLGLCWAALAATRTLWFYYLIFVLITLVGLLTTGLTYSHVVCATFRRSRGFSLAVGRSGVAVSGALLPALLYAVIDGGGWRAGYGALAALVLLVALPVVSLWIRPQADRTRRDDPARGEAAVPSLPPPRGRYVITISLAAALAYLPLLAIMTQAQPLLIDKALSPAAAARVAGLFGVASLAGAFGTGLLLDRFWAPAVAAVLLSLGAGGALLLALGPDGLPCAVAGVLLLGLTLGAEMDIVAYIVARYCGVRRYGSVFGFSVLGMSAASAAGSPAIGFLYDATGDYRLALLSGAGIFGLAAGAYLSLGAYPNPAPE